MTSTRASIGLSNDAMRSKKKRENKKVLENKWHGSYSAIGRLAHDFMQ